MSDNSGIYVGIDLGTTNSVVSLITEIDGRTPEIKVPDIPQPGRAGQRQLRQRMLPSVVYFEGQGRAERGFAEIIPRDTPPGQSGTSQRSFYLAEDGQSAVRLNLYRGRGEDDPWMAPLTAMKFELKKQYPRGTRVGLRWHVDRSKSIRIEGWLKDHPGEEPFVLEAEGNYLTEEEMEDTRQKCLCRVNIREAL